LYNSTELDFKKFRQNSWLLGTFVRAGLIFVLGLLWLNAN
jgi:hypothetical protein